MLDVGDLLVETLILKPVCINLSLVVLQLGDHVFELFGPFLEVLLVDLQFLGDLGPGLLGEYVLELDVELLLLLNEHVLLGDLLGLRDQPLLQRLDLLNQLVSLRVRALQLPPTMHVQRLLQLVREELCFLLLLEEFFLKEQYFPAEIGYASGLILRDNEESLELGDLILDLDDLMDLLLIVDLTLVEGRLLNLDLLIQNLELIISLYQLSAQYVSLVDDHVIVFPLFLLLLLSLSDHILEPGNVNLLGLNHVVARIDLLRDLFNVSLQLCVF